MKRVATLAVSCSVLALLCACTGASGSSEHDKKKDAAPGEPTAGAGAPGDAAMPLAADSGDAAQPSTSVGPGSGHDASFDAGTDAAVIMDATLPDKGTDSMVPELDAGHDASVPLPTGTTHLRVVSGAGTGTTAGHRLALTLGMPGPHGVGTSTSYRLRLGSTR